MELGCFSTSVTEVGIKGALRLRMHGGLWFASCLRNSTGKTAKEKTTVAQLLHYSSVGFKSCPLFLWQENKRDDMQEDSLYCHERTCELVFIVLDSKDAMFLPRNTAD